MLCQISSRKPEQAGVGVEGHLHSVDLLAGVVDRNEVLAAVLDPLDGAAQAAREPGDEEVLGEEVAAHAEVAARVGVAHVDAGDRDTEQG